MTASVPDDDPDFEWVDKTPQEAEAERALKKARIARKRGMDRIRAIVYQDDLEQDALEPESGVFAVPVDVEERLLRERGQAALDRRRMGHARAGKKRVPRPSAPLSKKLLYGLSQARHAFRRWLLWHTTFRRYAMFAKPKEPWPTKPNSGSAAP